MKTKHPFDDPSEPVPTRVVANGASDPLAISNAGHLANIRDSALVVREGHRPAVAGHDSRKVVRVLEMIYQQAGILPFCKAATTPHAARRYSVTSDQTT